MDRTVARLALGVLLAFISNARTPDELIVPREIHFNDTNVIHEMSLEAKRVVVFNHSDSTMILNMTTRMLCYQGQCTIPGPTLVFYPGVTARLKYINKYGRGSALGTDLFVLLFPFLLRTD